MGRCSKHGKYSFWDAECPVCKSDGNNQKEWEEENPSYAEPDTRAHTGGGGQKTGLGGQGRGGR
jgi:hypothetical protein